MSQNQNNGVDPQDLIGTTDRHRTPVHHVHAPPEATLEWNDAAVKEFRFLRTPVWGFGLKLSSDGLGQKPPPWSKQCNPRRLGLRLNPHGNSSRWTTTTSACSTTPWSRVR
jgi:hypothetical protein